MHQRLSQPVTTITVNTNENGTRAPTYRSKRLLDDLCDEVYDNDVVVSSCIFPKEELLDYDLVPEFSNYIYAFIFMLLPKTSSTVPRSLIIPEVMVRKHPTSVRKTLRKAVFRVSDQRFL